MQKLLILLTVIALAGCSKSAQNLTKTPTPPQPIQNELVKHSGHAVPNDVTSSINYTVYENGDASFVNSAGQTCYLDEENTVNAQFGIIPQGCTSILNPEKSPPIIGSFHVVHRTDGSFVSDAKSAGAKIICNFPSLNAANAALELGKVENFCQSFNTTGIEADFAQITGEAT